MNPINQQPTDQAALNLAKAIGQAETGASSPEAYNKKGASGEFGRYQFMPATYKQWAKKHLGDENAQPTIENQNKIAYSQIKEWKDQGLSPAQIASKWNSGRESAYKDGTGTGTNKFGVQYDVPGYVSKVSNFYNQIKGSGNTSGDIQQTPAVQDMPVNIPQQREEMQAAGEGVSVNPEKAKPSFVGGLIRGIIKPVATLAARPIQLARALGGATPEEQTIKSSYLGDIKAPTTASDVVADVGRGVQTVALGLGGGTAATGLANVGKQGLGQIVKQTALKEAGIGAIGGLGLGLEKAGAEKQNIGKAIGTIAENAAVGGLFGAGIGAVAPLAGSAYRSLFKGTQQSLDQLVGAVTRGDKKEVETAKKAFSSMLSSGVDIKQAKTADDLVKVFDTQIDSIATKLDDAFATDTNKYGLKDITQETKVGSFKIKQNHINDALGQLEDFYAKTNNPIEQARVAQLKAEVRKNGLSVQEINNIAKEHGRVLSGYNANGELASGLTKQAAENTRSGIKETGRKLFGNEAYEIADKTMSDLIKTRELVKTFAEKVANVKQVVVPKRFGESAVNSILNAIDYVSFGGLNGVKKFFKESNVGEKTFNYIGLEDMLQKNLTKIEAILSNQGLSEKDVIKQLESIVQSGGVKIPYKK